MEEFVIVVENENNPPSTTTSAAASAVELFFWTNNNTRLLIDLYKKYKSKVGTMGMKNFKTMWEKIANEISEILQKTVTSKNVENRWKVLDRNFKKYVDNKNSTGRGRKFFEFASEMEEACGNKKNIRPEILLANEIHMPKQENVEQGQGQETAETPKKVIRRKTRKTVLQQIREDRLSYQENRNRFLQQVHQDQLSLLRERNEIERERNEIEKERNNILLTKKCNCHIYETL